MKMQKLVVAVTALNFALLAFQLVRSIDPAGAETAVLRGRALEIVDERGRVRASIKLQPAGTANGVRYPETVMLRLVDAVGRPSVKIGGSAQGGAIGLVGDNDATQILLNAEGAETSLKLADKNGRQQLLKP
jgi:hypothetical protein